MVCVRATKAPVDAGAIGLWDTRTQARRPAVPITKISAPQKMPSITHADRYRQLLSLRVTLGCRLIDALSHTQHEGLSRLHDECTVLDQALEQSWRYRRDYLAVVLAAEERRFHTPGITRASDDLVRPCSWCRREAAAAPSGIALPARSAA
jgi:hypothetical protein